MKRHNRRQLPGESLVSTLINQQIDLLASMFELNADARTGSFRTLTALRIIGFPSQQATVYPKQQFTVAKVQSTENKEQSNQCQWPADEIFKK